MTTELDAPASLFVDDVEVTLREPCQIGIVIDALASLFVDGAEVTPREPCRIGIVSGSSGLGELLFDRELCFTTNRDGTASIKFFASHESEEALCLLNIDRVIRGQVVSLRASSREEATESERRS